MLKMPSTWNGIELMRIKTITLVGSSMDAITISGIPIVAVVTVTIRADEKGRRQASAQPTNIATVDVSTASQAINTDNMSLLGRGRNPVSS